MIGEERLAGASITGVALAYAQLRRLDRQQAMQEVQDRLAHYGIPADRIVDVLSRVAAAYVDGGRSFDAQALRLLVDAGADLDRARALREEARHQREQVHPPVPGLAQLRIGHTPLGG